MSIIGPMDDADNLSEMFVEFGFFLRLISYWILPWDSSSLSHQGKVVLLFQPLVFQKKQIPCEDVLRPFTKWILRH